MKISPSFATHNVCGLSLDNNSHFLPKSSDPKYISLKTILRDIDFIVLCETKVSSENFNFLQFCPFGRQLKPVTYSCSGQSDGLLIYANLSAISIVYAQVLVTGRLIKTKIRLVHSKNAACFIFYSVYLPSANPTLQSSILETISDNIKASFLADPLSSIILLGDFNIPDLRHPSNSYVVNSPSKILNNIMREYNLIDIPQKFGLLGPTWTGRGNRSHLHSTLDYILSTNNVFIQDVKFFVTARSDHVVLVCYNKKSNKKVGVLPNERLFLSAEFTNFAIPKLHECHENFTLSRPSVIEQNHPEYFIDWLDTLSTFLEHINKEYHASNFVSLIQKEKLFRNKMMKSLKKISRCDSLENKNELEKIRQEHILDVQTQVDNIHKRYRIMAAKSYGRRSNAFSFANFKSKAERKINSIQKLNTPDQLTFDPIEIAEQFALYHREKTSFPDFSEDLESASIPCNAISNPLNYIFQKFNISLDNFFPVFPNQNLHINFTESEVKEVIKSMRNFSTPGPTGRAKLFYLFLYNFSPSFFTKAINQLARVKNLSSPKYAWIKNRNIIFIPKKGKDRNLCESYRPISLLEVLYKIISKLLSSRITPFLDEILLPTQFGFMKNRTLNQCSTNVLLLTKELTDPKIYPNASLMFCDIKAAFDSVLPNTIDMILKHIFPNSMLPQMLHNLCNKGTATCNISGQISKPFPLEIGSSQGDPSSVYRFNLAHHLFIMFTRYLQAYLINQTIPSIPGTTEKHEPILFADDSILPNQFSNVKEVETFLYILTLGKIISGLSINPEKTQILVCYTESKNLPKDHTTFLSKLGKPTDSANHLGLIVEKSWRESAESSWKKTLTSLKNSSQKLLSAIGTENPIHRKQIVSTMLQANYNFVARVHPISASKIDFIDKLVRNAVWEKKINHTIYGRPKIAKHRLTDPISHGGLGMKSVFDQVFSALLSGAFNVLNFCNEFPQSFMAKKINLNEFRFCQAGSRKMEYFQRILTRIFPTLSTTEGLDFFPKFVYLLKNMETDKNYFWRAPLANTSLYFPFNLKTEDLPLTINAQSCVGTFLKPSPFPNPLEWSDGLEQTLNLDTEAKKHATKHLLLRMKKKSPYCPKKLVKLPVQKIANYFHFAIHQDNSFFSKALKYFNYLKATSVPPSFLTRIKDGIPMSITSKQFALSYRELAAYTIPASVHWIGLEILNRTILSPKLKFLNGQLPSPNCLKCDVVADNFHITNECTVAFMMNSALTNFLRANYPNLIFETCNFSLFTPIENASRSFNQQLFHLVINILHLSYHIQHEKRFVRFSPTNFYAKILTVIHSTLWLRKYSKWDYDLLQEFSNFYVDHLDTFQILFFPPNKSHFRENPPQI